MGEADRITVVVVVDADVGKAWESFISPDSITRWNFAGDTWACPRASNDLNEGGAFDYRMEARDGSAGFDFSRVYLRILPHRFLVLASG